MGPTERLSLDETTGASHDAPVSHLRRSLLSLPLCGLLPARAQGSAYVIARPDESPSRQMLDIERRVVLAYRSIGIDAAVQSLPPRRSAAYALHDRIDAELLRVKLDPPRNSYLYVPMPLTYFGVVALSHGRNLMIASPEALRDYRVGILTGIQALEDVSRHAKAIETAPDYASATHMLAQDRVDVALMLSSNAPHLLQARAAEWAQLDVRVANLQLARYTAYHFISPRHRRLLTPLAAAFKAQGLPVRE